MVKVIETQTNPFVNLDDDYLDELTSLGTLRDNYRKEALHNCTRIIESGRIDAMFGHLCEFAQTLAEVEDVGDAESEEAGMMRLRMGEMAGRLQEICRNSSAHENTYWRGGRTHSRPAGNTGPYSPRREHRQHSKVKMLPIGWNGSHVPVDKCCYSHVIPYYEKCVVESRVRTYNESRRVKFVYLGDLLDKGNFQKVTYREIEILAYVQNHKRGVANAVYVNSKDELVISPLPLYL